MDAQSRNETSVPTPAWTAAELQQSLTTARREATRAAARLRLCRGDRDELEQDLLLAMWSRTRHYDPSRGAWTTFLNLVARHALSDFVRARRHTPCVEAGVIDLDAFAQGSSATLQDIVDLEAALDLARVSEELPEPASTTLRLVVTKGEISAAARGSSVSTATFYRSIGDVRFWLSANGLRPSARVNASAVR